MRKRPKFPSLPGIGLPGGGGGGGGLPRVDSHVGISIYIDFFFFGGGSVVTMMKIPLPHYEYCLGEKHVSETNPPPPPHTPL